MYVLYGGSFTRAIIVEMVMAEGDIAYELRNVDTTRGEHRSAAFLAINPAGSSFPRLIRRPVLSRSRLTSRPLFWIARTRWAIMDGTFVLIEVMVSSQESRLNHVRVVPSIGS